MKEDIRLPIGSLFTILGFILAVYGLVAPNTLYGSGLNVWTGLGMVLFGLWFLFLFYRSHKSAGKP